MKFRKKPIVIEAEQFFDDKKPYPEGVCVKICHNNDFGTNSPHIHTLEGIMIIGNSDWVITGIKGEKYPCKSDIFDATYEKVNDDFRLTK